MEPLSQILRLSPGPSTPLGDFRCPVSVVTGLYHKYHCVLQVAVGFTFDNNERYKVLTDVLLTDGTMTVVAAPVVADQKAVYAVSRWLATNDISIRVSSQLIIYSCALMSGSVCNYLKQVHQCHYLRYGCPSTDHIFIPISHFELSTLPTILHF